MKLVVFFLSALRALVQQAPNSISTAHQSVAAVTEQLHYVKLRHVLYVTYTFWSQKYHILEWGFHFLSALAI
jgi:hypothetical protein